MNYLLCSEQISLTVNSKGAEISSLIFNNTEYIWQANPDIWPRHAPVLFPIVGKLKNNEYTYNNKTFSLSQHGFARDEVFELHHKTDSELALILKDNPLVFEHYPFQFQLIVKYQLQLNSVICSYEIINTSDASPLYFSVGAHPGFKVPLLNTERFLDYTILLEGQPPFQKTKLEEGLLTNQKIKQEGKEVMVSVELFKDDALVYENYQIQSASLVSKISGRGVKLNCKHWPYFGIWAKKNCQEFVCLEPWFGIADALDCNQKLEEKRGIIKLDPKKIFNCNYSIDCF